MRTTTEPILTLLQGDPVGTPSAREPGSIVQTVLGPALIILGVLMLIIILMGRLRRRSRAGATSAIDPHERLEEIRQQATARSVHDDGAADAIEATQRAVAHVDNRIVMLEHLIADADERIRRLQGLVDDGGPPALDDQTSPEPSPLQGRVYELADRGIDPLDIARQLDQQLGKVELILALRPR